MSVQRVLIGPVDVRLLAVLLLAATLLPASPTAASDRSGDDYDRIVTHRLDGPRAQAPQDWTREEMLAAQPMPTPRAPRVPERQSAGPTPADDPGVRVAETPPDPRLDGIAAGATAVAPAVWSRFAVPLGDYQKPPYRPVGRIFVKIGNRSLTCTATSIGNYAIFTAGHCVYERGRGFASSLMFAPAYVDGKTPLGQWHASSVSTTVGWKTLPAKQGLGWDMGGAVLHPFNASSPANAPLTKLKPFHGRRLAQVVGAAAFAWGQGTFGKTWRAVGYPAAPPFPRGNRSFVCQSGLELLIPSLFSPPLPAIGCDLTGGSSGGPWFLLPGHFVNGVISAGRGRLTVSPYFGNAARDLRAGLVSESP